MKLPASDARLSQISTLWTLVRQAQRGAAGAVPAAQQALMERYSGAVYRYLLGALRDDDAALELFQDFVVRFLRGDFRRADPQRGRFRDYVRTVAINLVNDYHTAKKRQPRPLPADVPDRPDTTGDADAHFIDAWREELLTGAWANLAEKKPVYFAILLFHVRQPEAQSPEIAQALTQELGKAFTPGNIRVMLHRAREHFADLTLAQVVQSLEQPSTADIQQELRDLHLLKICGPALKRRLAKGA